MNNLIEKKSPFAIFDSAEKLNKVEPSYTYSMFITPLDEAILSAINIMLVASSALLFKLLSDCENVQNQHSISKRLVKLTHAQFVDKYEFSSSDGNKSAGKCYSLTYRGRGYLKSRGEIPNQTIYIQRMLNEDPTHIKRLLSANQYAISTGSSYEIGKLIFSDIGKKHKNVFRANAVVHGPQTIFVESVRAKIDETERILEKLQRISSVINRKDTLNTKITKNPLFVIVCENHFHQNRIKEELENIKTSKISNITIKITNDLDVYTGSNSLQTLTLKKKSSFLKFLFGQVS